MGHHVIEFDEQCKVCRGTGIYIGLAEKDGAGVQCCQCKGTGRDHFYHEYDDFTGRVHRDDVRHVLRANLGIMIGVGKDGQYTLGDFGGMAYESWWAGDEFPPGSEMRKFTCPAWWYQTVDYERKPKWDECRGCGAFSACEDFHAKKKCWARWDEEFGNVSKEATT